MVAIQEHRPYAAGISFLNEAKRRHPDDWWTFLDFPEQPRTRRILNLGSVIHKRMSRADQPP